MIRICLLWGLLSQVYLIQTEDAPQPIPVTAHLFGDTVSLPCPKAESEQFLYWYRQTVGQLPHLVASVSYASEPVLKGEFKNPRFHVEESQYGYNLIIRNISTLDEATYFCGIGTMYGMDYGHATFLAVKGHSHPTLVQQLVSDPVHPGDSVILQCTVLSETCTGEHSVYWFRAGSGESHPGVIYTPGNRSDDCEKSPETPSPTHTCVYSLSKNNLSLSDAGTYYCAVATCGEILFGNGTNLNIERSLEHVIIGLGVTSVFCVIVMIILVFSRNKMTICEHYKVSVAQHIGHDNSTTECDQEQDPETLNYAALHFSERKTKRGTKKRETQQESVYSNVRYSD
ncbi:signal-regulatory protein beta-2 isoform X2 [Oncorhynchus mykiss]|uniref:signal-regulatory protein beta-2 isoform X2 n=1 Tax=Oncorhynchus mykiss TaxID=8022 RepID=UPI001878E0B6|nr:signal-regulatory protein beta-2 isoform X2 [Oncorhynchus mykiss]